MLQLSFNFVSNIIAEKFQSTNLEANKRFQFFCILADGTSMVLHTLVCGGLGLHWHVLHNASEWFLTWFVFGMAQHSAPAMQYSQQHTEPKTPRGGVPPQEAPLRERWERWEGWERWESGVKARTAPFQGAPAEDTSTAVPRQLLPHLPSPARSSPACTSR